MTTTPPASRHWGYLAGLTDTQFEYLDHLITGAEMPEKVKTRIVTSLLDRGLISFVTFGQPGTPFYRSAWRATFEGVRLYHTRLWRLENNYKEWFDDD